MAEIRQIRGSIKNVAVAKLTAHPKNSKTHGDEQIAALCRAITKFGFNVPVLVDEDGVILAGHARVQAAKQLKMKKVPTISATKMSAAEKRAFIIADNKLAERGGWDQDMLSAEVLALSGMDFDMDTLGFDPLEVAGILDDDRTGFLGDTGGGGGEPTDVVRTSEFVQLNFTLTAEKRKTVMDFLRCRQQELGVSTAVEALIDLCSGE